MVSMKRFEFLSCEKSSKNYHSVFTEYYITNRIYMLNKNRQNYCNESILWSDFKI